MRLRDGAGGRRVGSQEAREEVRKGVSRREEGRQTWSKKRSVRGRERGGRRRAGMDQGEKCRRGREGVKEAGGYGARGEVKEGERGRGWLGAQEQGKR